MKGRDKPTLVPGGKARAVVKACLNGGRARSEHRAVPLTASELAADARAAAAAGAAVVHVHPRTGDGSETLDSRPCKEALEAIRRAAPGVPVSLTTGLWLAPNAAVRLEAVAAWEVAPDLASVNFGEEGAAELCKLLERRGVGIEAGLASIEDARFFLESGIAHRCARVLVEPEAEDSATAVATAAQIAAFLGAAGIDLPQVHHGVGIATWAVIAAALQRGHGIRAGLEDTLVLPDGTRAKDNAALISTAVGLSARSPGPLPSI